MAKNPFTNPDYLGKFGLKETPYSTNPNERYLYLTNDHKESINMIGRVIENRTGVGLVKGKPGTGKTTVMRYVFSQLSDSEGFKVAVIENAGRFKSEYQMILEIMQAFGQDCKGIDTKTRYDQLATFILDQHRKGVTPVLLIDEAQHMSAPLLESLRGMLNIETPEIGKLIQIFLFAMPNIQKRLPYSPSLKSRIGVNVVDLLGLTELETTEMLKWRFLQAGGDNYPFEPQAVSQIFIESNGNPRSICALAQVCLEYSGRAGQLITPGIVQEIAKNRLLK